MTTGGPVAVVAVLINQRKALGLTQTDIARLLSVTSSTVGHFELGRATPRLDTLERYAAVVGMQLAIVPATP
ncbi:helix-turn-helix domain-containing protein [Mycolicibacterium mucogenicum]|uniref:Helix-turn-helix transcriptional regulator n=1 Tax=Mycolicibacterium mucogenicum DSM 44124 TaxID=1226753 RepID=A0A8H2PHX2_MYCMU|nr:helix-turn-helix transcriptional regulator [Mycolicibacterium mucogenicum]KAB7752780.1 Cro/Cl family transcriptional regulator [Mycolicibacterium mucogenicum DSM 44124]QPG69114.1 helix-turn-helix transcriptional regulator [Mycolicibacterium mucogenicum DSM 44124]